MRALQFILRKNFNKKKEGERENEKKVSNIVPYFAHSSLINLPSLLFFRHMVYSLFRSLFFFLSSSYCLNLFFSRWTCLSFIFARNFLLSLASYPWLRIFSISNAPLLWLLFQWILEADPHYLSGIPYGNWLNMRTIYSLYESDTWTTDNKRDFLDIQIHHFTF